MMMSVFPAAFGTPQPSSTRQNSKSALFCPYVTLHVGIRELPWVVVNAHW